MFVYGLTQLVKADRSPPTMCNNDMDGKIVLITGSTSGLGLHAAKALFLRGATVIITYRDHARGKAAVEEILAMSQEKDAQGRIHLFELDLCSYQSVLSFRREICDSFDRIDVCINNAGVMGMPFELTTDGIETHFATNQFGHFVLINQLLPLLEKSEQGRVVVVSSGMYKEARSLPSLKQLMGESTWNYEARNAYAVSKFANCLYVKELARRLAARYPTISVFCVRPGFVRGTELGRQSHFLLRKLAIPLIWMVAKNIDQGIVSIIHCSTAPSEQLKSGTLYYMKEEEAYADSVTPENAKRCWEYCMEMEQLIQQRNHRLTEKDKKAWHETIRLF